MPYNTTADVQDLPLNQATPEAMRVKKVVTEPEDLDFPSISLNFDNDNENDSSEEITPIKVSSPSRRRVPAVSPESTIAPPATPERLAFVNPEEDVIEVADLKTDHKRAEEAGFPLEEPLLKENPRRFVLFPIQDNDVRYTR